MSERDEPATAETPCAEAPDSRARAQDPPDVHDLLLALAGRLDDDLLAWARELVAVGEEGQAVELVTAALAAERVMLPAGGADGGGGGGPAAHTDLDVGRELAPPVPDDATVHRFDAAAASGDRVAAVLAGLPARRLAGCTLHLTWRSTPAGAAPGPVPRAVVLVEAGPDRSADVLAYLLATELDRAAVPASVEVFTTGTTLPAYHRGGARRGPADRGGCLGHRAGRGGRRPDGCGGGGARSGQAGGLGRLATPASVDPATATGRAEPTVPAVREPGRPPAGRSRPRAGRTRRRCSWCPRRTRSPRCRARRAAPHGDAGRRPAGRRSRRSPVVRRRPEPVRRTAGRAAARSTLTGAPIPPVPDLRTSRPTPTRSTARCGFRCWRRCSIPRPREPTNRTTGLRTPPRSVPCPRSRRPAEPRRLRGRSSRSRPRPGPGASRLVAPAPPSRPTHLPTLDRAASSRRASSPTFRPAGGDGTPTTSRPARPGRSRPSWRRAAPGAGAIRAGRARRRPARTTCRRSGRTTGGRVNGRCPRPSRRCPLPTARSPRGVRRLRDAHLARRRRERGRADRTHPAAVARGSRAPRLPAAAPGPARAARRRTPPGPGSRTRHVRSPISSARTRAARSRSRRQVVGTVRSPRRDPIGRAARGRRPTCRCSTRPPHGSAPRRGRPDRPGARSRPRPRVTHDVPCLWTFRRRARTTSRSSARRLRRPEACPKDRHRTSRARDVAAARTRTSRRPPLPRQRTRSRRCSTAPSATCWPSCRPSSPPGNAARARTVEPAPTPIRPSTATGSTATGPTGTASTATGRRAPNGHGPTDTARTGTTRTGTGRTVTATNGTGTARPATAPRPDVSG